MNLHRDALTLWQQLLALALPGLKCVCVRARFIIPTVRVGRSHVLWHWKWVMAYWWAGRLMAILIEGDAQLAQVMLHRQQRFRWLDNQSSTSSPGGEPVHLLRARSNDITSCQRLHWPSPFVSCVSGRTRTHTLYSYTLDFQSGWRRL